mmetsp:Transcript_56728/g.160044  ORF Transcript_56728/g.160044 Transcript_56728/m.160044 type:complete len:205 (+) Transcript_56728:829-1443(+)
MTTCIGWSLQNCTRSRDPTPGMPTRLHWSKSRKVVPMSAVTHIPASRLTVSRSTGTSFPSSISQAPLASSVSVGSARGLLEKMTRSTASSGTAMCASVCAFPRWYRNPTPLFVACVWMRPRSTRHRARVTRFSFIPPRSSPQIQRGPRGAPLRQHWICSSKQLLPPNFVRRTSCAKGMSLSGRGRCARKTEPVLCSVAKGVTPP